MIAVNREVIHKNDFYQKVLDILSNKLSDEYDILSKIPIKL